MRIGITIDEYLEIFDSLPLMRALLNVLSIGMIISLIVLMVFLVVKILYYRKKDCYKLTVTRKNSSSLYLLYLSKKDVANIKVYQQPMGNPEEMKLIVAETLVLNDITEYTLSKVLSEDRKGGTQIMIDTRF